MMIISTCPQSITKTPSCLNMAAQEWQTRGMKEMNHFIYYPRQSSTRTCVTLASHLISGTVNFPIQKTRWWARKQLPSNYQNPMMLWLPFPFPSLHDLIPAHPFLLLLSGLHSGPGAYHNLIPGVCHCLLYLLLLLLCYCFHGLRHHLCSPQMLGPLSSLIQQIWGTAFFLCPLEIWKSFPQFFTA